MSVRYALAMILLFPGIGVAETYLCVPEASAGIRSNGIESIKAQVYQTDSQKYVLTDEGGSWVLKVVGKDDPYLKCSSAHNCGEDLFFGLFQRQGNLFTIVSTHFGANYSTQDLVVSKGKCSKL